MSRSFNPADLPDDIVRAAEVHVAAGRFASIEEVLRAGLSALSDEMADNDEATVWQAYKARSPVDPRDMTTEEVAVCLDSEDSERQAALDAHLDALTEDMRAGRGVPGTTTAMMADIRGRPRVRSGAS
jgi:Arc/MetJ-type ribon-helix-helix transcriptional regulator